MRIPSAGSLEKVLAIKQDYGHIIYDPEQAASLNEFPVRF
jgi:hypothetical protein